MSVTAYKIIEANDPADMLSQAAAAIAAGWQPVGSAFPRAVKNNPGAEAMLCQAFIQGTPETSTIEALSLDLNVLSTQAGAGITGGVGTVYKSSAIKAGGIIKTSILIDLTGLASSTTDLDIIGVGASAAHLGRITAADNGTILTGTMTCLETPAGGADDIDLYSATEGTGVFDGGIAALTETALLTRGAPWAAGDIKPLTAWPAANAYLYLTGGEAGTADTYTAGKFLLELSGYDA